MADLRELAERCEAAEGPDRGIDYTLACWFNAGAGVPAYTASLDAALTLVPEGADARCSFKVESFYLGNGIWKSRAAVWDGLGSVSSLDTASDAATPALALCAAALKARAQAGEPK